MRTKGGEAERRRSGCRIRPGGRLRPIFLGEREIFVQFAWVVWKERCSAIVTCPPLPCSMTPGDFAMRRTFALPAALLLFVGSSVRAADEPKAAVKGADKPKA